MKGRVEYVPMRNGPPRRLAPLLDEPLRLHGHHGRYSNVDGVQPQKKAPLPSRKRASTATMPWIPATSALRTFPVLSRCASLTEVAGGHVSCNKLQPSLPCS